MMIFCINFFIQLRNIGNYNKICSFDCSWSIQWDLGPKDKQNLFAKRGFSLSRFQFISPLFCFCKPSYAMDEWIIGYTTTPKDESADFLWIFSVFRKFSFHCFNVRFVTLSTPVRVKNIMLIWTTLEKFELERELFVRLLFLRHLFCL